MTAALLALLLAGRAAPTAEVRRLEERSLLRQTRAAAAAASGRGEQRRPYGTPQPQAAVRHASD